MLVSRNVTKFWKINPLEALSKQRRLNEMAQGHIGIRLEFLG